MDQFLLGGFQPSGSFQHQTVESHPVTQLSQDEQIGTSIDQQIDYLPTIVDVSAGLATNGVVMMTIIALTLFVREIRLLVVACKG
jgi:hypothetical protein